jgi:hypothetical protein
VVYDGAGQPVCVIRTDDLSVGSLDEVLDPAFAWDEGEGDRTYEDWLAQHSAYWQRVLPNVGAEFTPKLGVVLKRFSVLWPQRDEAEVLAAREDAYVRPVWIEDRDWLADTMRQRWDGVVISRGQVLAPARLPALVAVDWGGLRLGALTFRPRPGSGDGVETEVVTVDALESGRVSGPCCWMPSLRWRGARAGEGCGSSPPTTTPPRCGSTRGLAGISSGSTATLWRGHGR